MGEIIGEEQNIVQSIITETNCDGVLFEGREQGLSADPVLPSSPEEWQEISDELRSLSPESLRLLIQLYPERMDLISRGLVDTMIMRNTLRNERKSATDKFTTF